MSSILQSPCLRRATRDAAEPSVLRLEQLIQRYAERVRSQVARLGVAHGDVDDVCQRVWLTASRSMPRIRSGSELAYLRAVARHEASHMRRSYARRPEVTDSDLEHASGSSPSSEELIAQRQRLERVAAALGGMDATLRTVLVMFELDEASSSEIARTLGIPLGTAKSRLRRAREELVLATCQTPA